MGLIPNIFEPGEVAASSDVNENFQAIADVVGDASTASRLNPPGDIVVGPRDNAQLSARGDTRAGSATSFVQLSWNADLYASGSTWRVRRFHDGEPATFVRIGSRGFEIYTTSRTSGNLNNQANCVFHIEATKDDDYVYIRPNITRVDRVPSSLEHYRLTLVLFEVPAVIYENATIYKGTKTHRATDYGVATHARAVLLAFEGQATTNGRILLTQARSNRSQRYGFIVSGIGNQAASGQGIVPLGTQGDYEGKFVEDRSMQWTSASLYIQGYFV